MAAGSQAQLFGQQLRAAGRTATLFGSDGLFDPDNFKIPGSTSRSSRSTCAAPSSRHTGAGPGSGESELFGLPTYVATDVVARAIEKACRNGQATRGEVRRFIGSTLIPKSQSLLGFAVRFVSASRRR